nr:K+ transporter homologue [Schizosaccharomyces pombe]
MVQVGDTNFWIQGNSLYLHISLTIIASVLLFTGGTTTKIKYIDALFLASSATTQTGLNSVDLNSLSIWQQFILYGFTAITVPIWMHGSISFIRLYWFRRKFKDVVRQNRTRKFQRKLRKSLMKKSEDDEEQGVRGRKIRVMLPYLHSLRSPTSLKNFSRFDTHDSTNNPYFPDNPPSPKADISKDEYFGKYLPKKSDTLDMDLESHNMTFHDYEPSIENKNYDFGSSHSASMQMYEMDDLHPRLRRQSSFISSVNPLEADYTRETLSEGALVQESLPMAYSYSDTNLVVSRDSFTLTGDDNLFPEGGLRPANTIDGIVRSSLSSSSLSKDTEPSTVDMHIAFTGLNKPTIERERNLKLRKKSRFYKKSLRSRFSRGLHRPIRWTKSFTSNRRNLTLERVLSSAFAKKHEPSISSRHTTMSLPYLSYNPTVDRNSAFVALSKEQRDELGGIEYRALKCVCSMVILYFIIFNIAAFVTFIVFAYTAVGSREVIDSYDLRRGWWALFSSASSFNDLGFSLIPSSFVPMNRNIFLLLISSLFIIAGNTGFPCFFRTFIWTTYKLYPFSFEKKEAMAFLLDHPRRCFTLLFPSGATWVLFFVLLLLNVIDLVLFMVLDTGSKAVASLPKGIRVVNAIFQSVCTRTAGFTSVSISELHPAVLVSYMVMMYISVYPVAINMRNTNVYEERSLGVYRTEDDEGKSFLKDHLTEQLSYDLWYIFLGLFIICICEGGKISNPLDTDFSIFTVLFEVVSAYGTVGLSTGLSSSNCSLSARFTTISKLVIIALELRGRHRGLPRAVVRAILLPSEKNNLKEEEDYQRRHGFSIDNARGSIAVSRD